MNIKLVCDSKSSISDYIVGEKQTMKWIVLNEFIKQWMKSTWMFYYFRRDSEVRIWWSLYYPMMPHERSCEWEWSFATDSVGYMTISFVVGYTNSYCIEFF